MASEAYFEHNESVYLNLTGWQAWRSDMKAQARTMLDEHEENVPLVRLLVYLSGMIAAAAWAGVLLNWLWASIRA